LKFSRTKTAGAALVPKGLSIIARRFNAGKGVAVGQVPKGRLKRHVRDVSVVPSGLETFSM
jgi:hypothetical protein